MESRAPEEYDWILLQFNAAGVTPTVVAGQAVNIWGKTFLEWNRLHFPHQPKIADLLPLTSEDMEILSTVGTSKIDKFSGVVGRPHRTDPFAKAAGPDTKTVYLQSPNGQFKVQVLAWVNGLDQKEIHRRAVPVSLGKEKAQVLVPDPIALLEGKIANCCTLDQAHRHDFKHVQILIGCIHALIAQDFQDARGTLNRLRRLKRIAGEKYGRLMKKNYSVDWRYCVPQCVIDQARIQDKQFLELIQTLRLLGVDV